MSQKIVISNRIYLRPDNDLHRNELLKALTYKIEKKVGNNPKAKYSSVELIKNYKVLPQGVLSLPQGRMDLVPKGLEVVDKRILHPVPFPNAKFPLNSEQLKIYNQVTDSCFLNAKVGWGRFCPTLK